MSKQDSKDVTLDATVKQTAAIFTDSFIIMVCLGAIASIVGVPELAIGYGTAILIKIVSMCVLPQEHMTNQALLKLVDKQ